MTDIAEHTIVKPKNEAALTVNTIVEAKEAAAKKVLKEEHLKDSQTSNPARNKRNAFEDSVFKEKTEIEKHLDKLTEGDAFAKGFMSTVQEVEQDKLDNMKNPDDDNDEVTEMMQHFNYIKLEDAYSKVIGAGALNVEVSQSFEKILQAASMISNFYFTTLYMIENNPAALQSDTPNKRLLYYNTIRGDEEKQMQMVQLRAVVEKYQNRLKTIQHNKEGKITKINNAEAELTELQNIIMELMPHEKNKNGENKPSFVAEEYHEVLRASNLQEFNDQQPIRCLEDFVGLIMLQADLMFQTGMTYELIDSEGNMKLHNVLILLKDQIHQQAELYDNSDFEAYSALAYFSLYRQNTFGEQLFNTLSPGFRHAVRNKKTGKVEKYEHTTEFDRFKELLIVLLSGANNVHNGHYKYIHDMDKKIIEPLKELYGSDEWSYSSRLLRFYNLIGCSEAETNAYLKGEYGGSFFTFAGTMGTGMLRGIKGYHSIQALSLGLVDLKDEVITKDDGTKKKVTYAAGLKTAKLANGEIDFSKNLFLENLGAEGSNEFFASMVRSLLSKNLGYRLNEKLGGVQGQLKLLNKLLASYTDEKADKYNYKYKDPFAMLVDPNCKIKAEKNKDGTGGEEYTGKELLLTFLKALGVEDVSDQKSQITIESLFKELEKESLEGNILFTWKLLQVYGIDTKLLNIFTGGKERPKNVDSLVWKAMEDAIFVADNMTYRTDAIMAQEFAYLSTYQLGVASIVDDSISTLNKMSVYRKFDQYLWKNIGRTPQGDREDRHTILAMLTPIEAVKVQRNGKFDSKTGRIEQESIPLLEWMEKRLQESDERKNIQDDSKYATIDSKFIDSAFSNYVDWHVAGMEKLDEMLRQKHGYDLASFLQHDATGAGRLVLKDATKLKELDDLIGMIRNFVAKYPIALNNEIWIPDDNGQYIKRSLKEIMLDVSILDMTAKVNLGKKSSDREKTNEGEQLARGFVGEIMARTFQRHLRPFWERHNILEHWHYDEIKYFEHMFRSYDWNLGDELFDSNGNKLHLPDNVKVGPDGSYMVGGVPKYATRVPRLIEPYFTRKEWTGVLSGAKVDTILGKLTGHRRGVSRLIEGTEAERKGTMGVIFLFFLLFFQSIFKEAFKIK